MADREEIPLDPAELRQRLHRAVMRICPSWLRAQADDMVQTALMRVMAARTSGRGSEEITAVAASYLQRAAYAVLVDEIRRLRRLRESPLDDRAAVLPERGPRANPERMAEGREFSRALTECLAGLRQPRRLVVTLYLQGHTVPEAARILAWTAKRTQNLATRGLVDLRGCLKRKGLEPWK